MTRKRRLLSATASCTVLAALCGAAVSFAQQSEQGNALEEQIHDELRRHEEFLRRARSDQEKTIPSSAAGDEESSELSDPRVAPAAPIERWLPLALFDEERVSIPPGTWGSKHRVALLKRTLDADRDGTAEQVRFYDPESDELIRSERDRDFDGRIDLWKEYDEGRLFKRSLDTNADGSPDVWERYAGERMSDRVVDRDHDGVRDAFFAFKHGSLVEERHDADNDGRIDVVTTYEDRERVETREDRDGDGAFDTRTSYHVVGGEELIERVERDTRGRGEPNVVETFEAKDGRAILARKEEDTDGDGTPDITSIYRDGKLIRREVFDPSLLQR